MKKILGLDLGVGSIGWALVNEAEYGDEKSSIIKLGVRVNPLTVDEQTNFEKGKPITTTADRTLKRSMRRNLQRFKLRRDNLIEILKENNFITDNEILSENGNRTTFETWRLRAKAAVERIELNELARVLLAINKKRGYKSSRKAKSADEGELIDGMAIARRLYDEQLTPGQLLLQLYKEGKKSAPAFYRSDLCAEFDAVWKFQKQFYPEVLTDEFYKLLDGKAKLVTSKLFLSQHQIYLAENKDKYKKFQALTWRARAVTEQLTIGEVAFVLTEINGAISGSSGYLGAIGDRSKELVFNRQTVGQYLMARLDADPNYSLKNQVFYRQDYLDEFERIWDCQVQYHKELTAELKREIRDVVIFYQRSLKSQKGLISFCEFESQQVELNIDGKTKTKTIGRRVAPRSSFIFQEFKIWQTLNNLEVKLKGVRSKKKSKDSPELNFDAENPRLVSTSRPLYEEEKLILLEELTYRGEMKKDEVLKLLFENYKDLDLNFAKVEGNRTMAAIYEQLFKIIELSGHGEHKLAGLKAEKIKEIVKEVLCDTLGMKPDLLVYNATLDIKDFEKQPIFKLWHLLYSFEGDSTVTGDGKLVEKLVALTGLDAEYAKVLAQTTFQSDYGSLSTKAMCRLLPHLRQGLRYDEACALEYKTHSKQSLTKEELENKEYKDRLDILAKNSLRNPVVEKIINQMIHVVNGVIDAYGKPDEIRIELARDLKKNADERAQMTDAINKTTKEHEDIRKILQSEFGLSYVSRTDIIRYKLYKELEPRGYHTLYSNTYIPQEKLFSKEFDIEHIIPQSKLFNDSFANKTLEARDINIEKGNKTAYDYVCEKYGEVGIERYLRAIDDLNISKSKKRNLLASEADIPKDFINRDLGDTQYIAKKSRELLLELVPFVVSTTGSITDRLREDWQLINVLQELNWDKYDRQGLTYFDENRDGHRLPRIKDWTKRNDHRHHAMDALTIAFTKPSFIQYLNNLNARSDKSGSIYGIEQKELHRTSDGHLLFNPPMPLGELRAEARRHLGEILVSIKAKNKVVTRNVNTTKTKGGVNKKVELTPRGMLHKETVYGRSQEYATTLVKVGASMTLEQIRKVANAREREVLLARLCEFGGDTKKAFTGKNSLEKNPIYLNAHQTEKLADKVKCVELVERYTIRKEISPDLKLDKVVDAGVRAILQSRLDEYKGDAKKAFANLDENPIWLNKEKGIKIKRVTISGVSNAVALHDKRDKDGQLLLDAEGKKQSADFVSTGSNHHVAIYRDADGNLQEQVVSMYEATQRVMQGLPIVDKQYKADEGWRFLFTMKQNEYFVFPRYEIRINDVGEEERVCVFDPAEIDLMNPMNNELISQNLYRVQKLATKNYMFRHHLETSVGEIKLLKNITWINIFIPQGLLGIIKVRVNHIGQIVSVGEY